MLTVRQILNTLPSPYNEEAIAEAEKYFARVVTAAAWVHPLDCYSISLPSKLLCQCFIWSETKRGYSYWNDFVKTLLKFES